MKNFLKIKIWLVGVQNELYIEWDRCKSPELCSGTSCNDHYELTKSIKFRLENLLPVREDITVI